MIQELINKFAPMLEKHGVKLSAAEETAKIEMAVEGALAMELQSSLQHQNGLKVLKSM